MDLNDDFYAQYNENLPIPIKPLEKTDVPSTKDAQKIAIINKLKESTQISSPEHVKKSIEIIQSNRGSALIPLLAMGGVFTIGAILAGVLAIAPLAIIYASTALIAVIVGIVLIATAARGSTTKAQQSLDIIYKNKHQQDPNYKTTTYEEFMKRPENKSATAAGWDRADLDISEFAKQFTLSQLQTLEKEVNRLDKKMGLQQK